MLHCDLAASINVKKIKETAVLPTQCIHCLNPYNLALMKTLWKVLPISPTLAVHVSSLMKAVLMQRSPLKRLMPDSIPTFLHGLECTVLLVAQVYYFQNFIVGCVRKIMAVSLWEKRCNVTLHMLTRQCHVSVSSSTVQTCLFMAILCVLYM